MFHFETRCSADVPELGGRWGYGGCLLEVEGRVVWGPGIGGGVYWLDELEDRWKRWTDVEIGSTIGVCGGSLVTFGGNLSRKVKVWRGGEWNHMPDMLVACNQSCIVSVGEGGLVIGGKDDDFALTAVQVFNGKTQTWHFGPSLPEPSKRVSAVVHGDLVFVMGGWDMARAVWCANINDLTYGHAQNKKQSAWRQLPDVPYWQSSVCVVDGVVLAIGGYDGSTITSAIYAFHPVDEKWQHIGDMSFECWSVDSLLLSSGRVLVVDGHTQRVMRITVEGVATLFPNVPNQKNADERSLYEEAMTKGYVETSVTKCLILGAAGVGKTHLKHLLLKKDPPKQRISTGLADNPVRAISFTLAGVGGQGEDDWFVVEDDQALLSVIGVTIKRGVPMAPSLEDVVCTLPKMAMSVPSDDPIPVPADMNTTKDTSQQSRTVAIEDVMIRQINHSSDKKKLFGAKWIQFIDSGGQLQYHDILPLFVQNTSVTLFVLKLSEQLSHCPTIEYYGADGKPVGKPCQSYLSHKHILQHCLGAIRSSDSHPLIIIVGTHRDVTYNRWCNETIEEKNRQLKALLDPTCFCVLHNGQELKEVIFPVNGKAPQNVDRHNAQVLRKAILSMSPPLSIKIPIAWFGLEVLLQRSSHDGVLSLAECQAFAKRLHIEGDAFSAALHHLVHHSMFLYYPVVLPQTVFCDPQVVLTKVTELVEYHHRLKNNPDKGVADTGDLVMFRDHGLLSLKLLRKFIKHYKEGVFSPQDLLELLVSLHAIAMIKESEYLMPALLPHLDSDQVPIYCQQRTALVIKPTQGCIPSGLFCCLVAYLLSPTNSPSPWKVCMERDKPLCLLHNCISFVHKDTPGTITLVDMHSYIQVHVSVASSAACREIRGCVYSGIKSACSVLKYSHVQFEDAFMCAGASCISDPPHVAVVMCSRSPRGKVYKWRCTIMERQCGNLSEDQLMWFVESAVTEQPSTSESCARRRLPEMIGQVVKQLEEKPTLLKLLSFTESGVNIAEQIGVNYFRFGMILLQDENGVIVKALEEEHRGNVEKINTAIFQKWLDGRGMRPVTWSTLVTALQSIRPWK